MDLSHPFSPCRWSQMISSVPQTIQSFPGNLHNTWRRQGGHPWPHVTEDKQSPEVFNSHLRSRSKPKTCAPKPELPKPFQTSQRLVTSQLKSMFALSFLVVWHGLGPQEVQGGSSPSHRLGDTNGAALGVCNLPNEPWCLSRHVARVLLL